MENHPYYWQGEEQDRHVKDWVSDVRYDDEGHCFEKARTRVCDPNGNVSFLWTEVDATTYRDTIR